MVINATTTCDVQALDDACFKDQMTHIATFILNMQIRKDLLFIYSHPTFPDYATTYDDVYVYVIEGASTDFYSAISLE
jgi:hypothetical protein